MKGKIEITYTWKRTNGGRVFKRHTDNLRWEVLCQLDKAAAGYDGGSMQLNVKTSKEDGPDGVSYTGSWKVERPTQT